MRLTKVSFMATIVFSLAALTIMAEGKKKNNVEKKESAAKTKVTQVQNQTTGTNPAPTTAPSAVIASVGSRKLTYGEFQAFKKFFAPTGGEDERIITIWKLNAALAEMADAEKFQKDPEAKAVLTIAQDQVLGSVFLRYKQLNATVTDEDVRNYYNQHQNDRELRESDFVTATLIAAEKREQADQIKKKIVDGANFDKLAEEYRQQTLKITGLSDIVIKNIATDQLFKPLGPSVALSMSRATLNEVNGPRQTPSGWLLFKVTARTQGKLVPLEKVEKNIREVLARQKQFQVRSDLIQQAEKMAGVKLEAPRQTRMPMMPNRPVKPQMGK